MPPFLIKKVRKYIVMKLKKIYLIIVFGFVLVIFLSLSVIMHFWNINKTLNIELLEKENQFIYMKKSLSYLNSNNENNTQNIFLSKDYMMIPKISELYGEASVIKDEKIQLLPSVNSPNIGKIYIENESKVAVYSEIISEEGRWVLINSMGTIGYVPLDSLSPYSHSFTRDEKVKIVSIEGVSLGDYIGDAIDAFGNRYLLANEEYGYAILFPENEVRDSEGNILGVDSYCVVTFDLGNKRIRSIKISKEDYFLESGIEVGSNIKEVIDYYGKQQVIKKNDYYSYQVEINKSEFLFFNVKEDGKIYEILLTEKENYSSF